MRIRLTFILIASAISGRATDLSSRQEVKQEKALKDVATAIAKEKGKVAEAAEEKAQSAEKARLAAKRKLAEAENKLGEVEVKLVEAASLNLAQANAIANLKATVEACED